MTEAAQDQRAKLPGFGFPVNQEPNWWYEGSHHDGPVTMTRLPNAISDWAADCMTVRERSMLAMVNQITDKPEWARKVFDEEIVAKWRTEALTDEGHGFSSKMFDHCIAELRDKAKVYDESGIIPILEGDVAVVKSDSIIPHDLKVELQSAIKPLENIPDRLKDWHPGSNEQVLDLVHPSLFPLLYGRSRILPEGTVGLLNCVESCGKGEVIPEPKEDDVKVLHLNASLRGRSLDKERFWSRKFQWLPCEVVLGENGKVQIASYINNLHPVHHEGLYKVIEKFIAKSIAPWSTVFNSIRIGSCQRVPMEETVYEFPQGESRPRDEDESSDDPDAYERDEQWLHDTRVLVEPDAVAYNSLDKTPNVKMDFKEFSKIQVIVKLATIHLTPEKPAYAGGSWHIEGQLNEHIAATALYYLDNSNITDSHLAFRQKVTIDEDINLKTYNQSDYDGVEYAYDIEQEGPGIQDLGQVLTREGRLLVFPNVLQHQVQPFKLVDETRPGHRKMLALFLIDPYQRIISTANVPPQQKDWWAELVRDETRVGDLPAELQNFIVDDVTDFPISMEEAKKVREELMEERRAFVDEVNEEYESEEFSFCEH
ncbi:uncharacterized protein BDZ99DRAFT_468593 [Mytilinidion resinicola]|uniref:Uncharacterized protein n=1 Tax=Mytilinidion resinicola TaxID=574789 RepID=A0A6A6Y326_9PEZI|nr:uncharacterized protein BDZ99DRAFT_468593 [Mytilinidion resinicola]KAF2802928.1 hypothetical protein BDZ99DRAFT_468593 [Mytilinidion resinicola]